VLESESLCWSIDSARVTRRGVALEQAGPGLERIVVGSLRRVPQSEAPLLAWPLVCGSVVAERTRALEFADSVLRVEVPDAGWKREMQGLAPRYVAQLSRYAGQKVARIEFVIRLG
jgi:Dna[CI] antecedent, DciA